MQFHPHGDASIGDALVGLGQKELLLDCQGNWGDINTGDSAAAARYIEARLSKFAQEVAFNPQLTTWQLSYDGRNKEPVTLPLKFPLLLAQGVDGIAVGLSTKVLPHNFCELCEASVDHINGKEIDLIPDFLQGGLIDATGYNGGARGGKVRIRALIEEVERKMLVIREIPYGTTTESVIESILKANDSGKIKIKKVVDNTAASVEIQIHLVPGVSPDITIDALYAFTQCQVSISPNACVIVNQKPEFLSVNEILRISTDKTVNLLKQELEIKIGELKEKLLFSSLEKIFIENRIYRDIEECTTFEDVIKVIHKGLDPFKPQFYRVITDDDVVRLTEIKIKRISKFDGFKADELMRNLQAELEETENNLANLKAYAIRFFKELLKKFGKGRERRTKIRVFDTIQASSVAIANEKLYINREEGFIGTGLKKDELIGECSSLDDIIVFRRDGTYKVVKVGDKVFVGKDILHASVFRKTDDRMVYNLLYMDGATGTTFAKRFSVTGITRDKEYDVTKGEKGSKVTYFSANPNGEAESVLITLSPNCTARVKQFEYSFAGLDIKNRGAQGNTVTKYPVRKVALRASGVSTLGSITIHYDDVLGRLNTDGRGKLLGQFGAEDRIVVLNNDATYELTDFKLTNRYDVDHVIEVAKLTDDLVVTAAYLDGETKNAYLKRFKVETGTLEKKFGFITGADGSKLYAATVNPEPQVNIQIRKGKTDETMTYPADALVEVRGWKALGVKLPQANIKNVTLASSASAQG
jgi:topoisomerase-4 subunit A